MTKLISLTQAVKEYVKDGDCVYAAGFTHLIPFAAGHEIIRQGGKDLTLARATPDLIYDQMVAAGCARKVIFSYMGNPGVGSLRIVRSELEAGRLEWEEYSHFAMISRLQAGATGLPFMPMNPTAADDLEKANPLYRTVTDPYSGGSGGGGAGTQAGCGHRPCAARGRERQRPHLGHHRRAKGSRLRCRTRDPDRRGNRLGRGDPLGPQPHADPRVRCGCGVPCAVLQPPILYPGILRPG